MADFAFGDIKHPLRVCVCAYGVCVLCVCAYGVCVLCVCVVCVWVCVCIYM